MEGPPIINESHKNYIMSNRRNAFSAPAANPAKVFVEWKSNDKCFSSFHREQKEKIQIPLPFNFLVLDELHAVKGWHDASQSGIYSNEVKFISKDPLTVKVAKGGVVAKGIYKEIKEKIVAAGGRYIKSIYIMLEDGTLANLQLKGSAVQKWSEFTMKTKNRLPDEWVTVKEASEGKKGAVTFNVPEFTFSRSLSDSEAQDADAAFDELEAYLKTYLTKSEPVEQEVVAHEEDDDVEDMGDLDF